MSKLLIENFDSIDLNHMAKVREEIKDKWEKSGLLDGIKGLSKNKENLAKLYECCKSAKLDDGLFPHSIKIITELKPDHEIVGMIKSAKEE